MRHTSLLVLLGVVMLATPVVGAPITYTFSGEGGLAGGFILDDEAEWVITEEPLGTFGFLSSALHTLWGTFGAYEFAGTPTLNVFDDPGCCAFNYDFWIVRTPITFSAGGFPAITQLNLFIYGGVNGISLIPPVPASPNQFNFSYAVVFSDRSFITGALRTLVVQVTEPPSDVLPFVAFAALAAVRFLTRFERARQPD